MIAAVGVEAPGRVSIRPPPGHRAAITAAPTTVATGTALTVTVGTVAAPASADPRPAPGEP